MKVEGAPANATLYSNLLYGEQMTGGSSSLPYSYEQLRQVGAAVRQMLVSAAANAWNVPVNEVSVSHGDVYHDASNRLSTFGELAELAALQPVPEAVVLKAPEHYRLVGSDLRRIDIPGKTDGTVKYTQDFTLPGMLTAVVAHAPRFGATLKNFDGAAAKAVEGVVDVVGIPTGVAVVATDFWTAQKARELLTIDWDETNAFTLSSEDIVAEYRSIVETEGTIARDAGSITDSFAKAQQIIEADFEFPFLAHSAIEPLNCIVQLSSDQCEIWNAAQQQTRDQRDASAILGLAPEQIKVNMLYAGGAFGRRANKDYTVEAVQVAKAVNRDAPIKLVWTREDDMRSGQYRPLNYHRLRAGIDSNGELIAWHHRLVGQSIFAQEGAEWIVDGIDSSSVHGANDWSYAVPNIRVDFHSPDLPVPVLWYRGTGYTHTAFAVESFIDEIAATVGRDPVEFRRSLLKDQPRMINVLQLVTQKANWGSSLGPDRGRGVAICERSEIGRAHV
jgi:isoquinoline 1-oxidoreductase beta subunit